MKKVVFLMAMCMITSAGFAQKRNINRAESLLRGGSADNLKEALSVISLAMKDPTTANDPATYILAGDIHYKYYEQEEVKRIKGEKPDQAVKNEHLVKAIDAYLKASELDMKPDEKGSVKPKYSKELKEKLEKYSNYLYNEGIYSYQDGNYKKAIELWGKYLDRPKFALLKNDGLEKDTLRNTVREFSIAAAREVPEMKPVAIRYMKELISEGYKEKEIYGWLYHEYIQDQDTINAVQTLKAGIKKFPDDMALLGNLINIYIYSGQTEEALHYLDDAIKNEPSNSQLYSVKGNILLRNKKDYEGASALYQKALKYDAANFSALSGLGLVSIMRADDIMEKARSIKDNNQYKTEKDKAEKEFGNAVQYLEKARALNPNDINNLSLLKDVYFRLNNPEYEKIDAEIQQLQNK